MRIGLTTAAFYGLMETEDAATHLATLGVPCCEVFLETYSEYNAAFGAFIRERLGEVACVSVHAKTQHFESDFLGASTRQRADSYAMLGSFLDAGRALGAHVYVYHGPASLRGQAPRFERWQQAIAQAMGMARARGITFCWETVSWCHLNSPDRVRAFRALWPDMHFVLDTKQVFEMGQDPMDYVEAMGDRLLHVHILDHDEAGKLTLPGLGVHDFQDLARALEGNGYTGDVILEPYASVIPSEQALHESLDWLRETFHAD